MKLELSTITPYLPYNLKCQYMGIINGKDLSEQDKAFKKDGMPFNFNIEPITGIKYGELKEILIFKNYWRAYIGNKGRALKSFHNGFDFKPVLKPMNKFNDSVADNEIFDLTGYYISVHPDFSNPITLEYQIFNILCKHHFDVFGLIDQELAVDINTIES